MTHNCIPKEIEEVCHLVRLLRLIPRTPYRINPRKLATTKAEDNNDQERKLKIQRHLKSCIYNDLQSQACISQRQYKQTKMHESLQDSTEDSEWNPYQKRCAERTGF